MATSTEDEKHPQFKGMSRDIIIQILRGAQAESREASEKVGRLEGQVSSLGKANTELSKTNDRLMSELQGTRSDLERTLGYLDRVREDDFLRDPVITHKIGDLSSQERHKRPGPELGSHIVNHRSMDFADQYRR